MVDHDRDGASAGNGQVERMLAVALGVKEGSTEVGEWSRRTLHAARVVLADNARRAYRRRVAAVLAAACVPLPLIAMYARTVLGWMHDVLAFVLPAPLPDVAVASYAAVAVLLVSASYAAVPVLVEITLRTPRAAHGE